MKKVKIIFATVAVVLALTNAYAFKSSPKHSDTSYFWVAADGTNDGLRTEASEAMLRGCSTGSTLCATAYSDPNHQNFVETIQKP